MDDDPRPQHPRSILLVDDEPAIADVLARALRGRGHTVRIASDGEAALAALREAPPGVLVLDISLPDITGWEVLRRLDAREREALPVIVYSASPLAPSRVHEFRPEGVLVKPFPMEALARLVDDVTRPRVEEVHGG